MRSIITICILTLSLQGFTQVVADMENLGITAGEWLDGSDMNGGWTSGHAFLPNSYNTDYQSWIGWAISATTDSVTPGFGNLYSSITGSGAESSVTYAVTYAFDPVDMILTDDTAGKTVSGLYISNSTYAYTSMRDGDPFAKKFGGETGEDPDFFFVTIRGYSNGTLTNDSVDHYFADFRFEDSNDDYIRNTWDWIDLTSLGNVDSLSFRLTSSDVGQFGMNTPAVFCVDNITTNGTSTSLGSIPDVLALSVFPNPSSDYLSFEWDGSQARANIIGSNGKILKSQFINSGMNTIDVTTLAPGTYFVRIAGSDTWIGRFTVVAGQ